MAECTIQPGGKRIQKRCCGDLRSWRHQIADKMMSYVVTIEDYAKVTGQALSDDIRAAIMIHKAPETFKSHILSTVPERQIRCPTIKTVATDDLLARQRMLGGPFRWTLTKFGWTRKSVQVEGDTGWARWRPVQKKGEERRKNAVQWTLASAEEAERNNVIAT